MIKFSPTYFLACLLLAFFSCSTDEVADKGFVGYDNQITFRPVITGTRAQELTTSNLTEFLVTAFNPSDKSLVGASGALSPYFSSELYEQIEGTSDFANLTHPEYCWPDHDETLTFIAFSHSPKQLRERCRLSSEDFFELQNSSKVINGNASLGYKMAKFRVPADIARQFDFVTAQAQAKQSKSSVELAFKHQLSQIVVKVCGHNQDFGIEIAGVCIGQPVEEATLDFNPSGGYAVWDFPEHTAKGRVSYTYCSGDFIKTLAAGQEVKEADAFSIMGNGGPAMVIPTKNKQWHGTEDPRLEIEDETMYLSVLMRVIDKDNELLFPYIDEDVSFTVVHLAVDNAGKVISAPLYFNSANGRYYDDAGMTTPFNLPSDATIRHYGWAAVPVDASWLPGKRYVYTLDYTSGIGIQDPVDPDPGIPIIVKSSIDWGVTVDDWEEPDPGFNPDPDINFDFD